MEKIFVELYSVEGKSYIEIENIMNINRSQVQELYDKTSTQRAEVQSIKSRFSKEREIGFGSFKTFYEWYLKYSSKCYYCETLAEDMVFLFKHYFEPKKPAWRKGTLQIERLDPDAGYNLDNCVLACVLCNNAKSDLIQAADYKSYFGEKTKEYTDSLLEQLSSVR